MSEKQLTAAEADALITQFDKLISMAMGNPTVSLMAYLDTLKSQIPVSDAAFWGIIKGTLAGTIQMSVNAMTRTLDDLCNDPVKLAKLKDQLEGAQHESTDPEPAVDVVN